MLLSCLSKLKSCMLSARGYTILLLEKVHKSVYEKIWNFNIRRYCNKKHWNKQLRWDTNCMHFNPYFSYTAYPD